MSQYRPRLANVQRYNAECFLLVFPVLQLILTDKIYTQGLLSFLVADSARSRVNWHVTNFVVYLIKTAERYKKGNVSHLPVEYAGM